MPVDHHFLRDGKVLILLLEESEHHLRTLRRGRKRERPMGPHQTKMLLLPLIQSFWVLSPHKRTAKSVNGSHAVSSKKTTVGGLFKSAQPVRGAVCGLRKTRASSSIVITTIEPDKRDCKQHLRLRRRVSRSNPDTAHIRRGGGIAAMIDYNAR